MNIFLKCIQQNSFFDFKTINIILNSSRPYSRSAKLSKIARKLGFPERPKAPLSPFLRFSNDVRPTLTDERNGDPQNVLIKIAALWKTVDGAKKAIYRQEFEKDMIIHRDKMREYKSRISEEQLAKLKQHEQQLIEKKTLAHEKKEQKRTEKLLGKPVEPLGAFLLFSSDLRRHSAEKISPSDIPARWKTLSESERRTYKDQHKKALEQFYTDLGEWVAKMRKVGYVVHSRTRTATLKLDSIRNEKSEELQKPKRPLNSFFIFAHDFRQTTPRKLRIREIAAKYNALSDDERKVYTDKAKAKRHKYVI